MEQIQQEKIFYQDSGVTVTQSRYIAGDKTYAMRNISSVSIFRIAKGKGLPYTLIVIGVLLAFSDDLRFLGIFLAAIGILWLVLSKDDYAVRISSNAGDANTLVSKDQGYIRKIVDALNEAIIHRG